MNATELFHQDGKTAGIFYCGKCRCVARSQAAAEQCCQNRKCSKCGKDTGSQLKLVCDTCQAVKFLTQEAERFAKADKITEWSGWVFCEGFGYHDGYFESIEDLLDFLDDEDNKRQDGESGVTYAWACEADQIVNVSLDDILQNIEADAYEGFDSETLKGLPEFKAAIAAFNLANAGELSYTPDYSKAILLPNA
jgi:hypothetical protein